MCWWTSVCVSGCPACRWTRCRCTWRANGALRQRADQWSTSCRCQTNRTHLSNFLEGKVVVETCHLLNCYSKIFCADINQRDVAFVWVKSNIIQVINSFFELCCCASSSFISILIHFYLTYKTCYSKIILMNQKSALQVANGESFKSRLVYNFNLVTILSKINETESRGNWSNHFIHSI